ncbi:MAG: AEC family transporter [Pseudomonadota bacterium]
MLQIIEIIIPICALVVLGFLARRFGLVKANADDVIGDFVFKIAIPILLFRLLATASLDDVDPWPIWITYFASVALVWLLAAVLLPILFKREALYGVIGSVASAFANTVLIGIPVIIQAYGETGMVSLSIVLSVHLPLMLLATIIHHDIAQAIDGGGGIVGESLAAKAKRFLKTIFTNPIMIGIMSGVAFRLSGLEMPGVVNDFTGKIAGIAGPMALIVLGMGLQKYGVKGNTGPALLTSSLKLGVMPLTVLILGHHVFELPPVFTAGLVLAAAAPSGVNSYLFAQHFGTGQALSANSISISTPLSIITISIWLFVLKTYVN